MATRAAVESPCERRAAVPFPTHLVISWCGGYATEETCSAALAVVPTRLESAFAETVRIDLEVLRFNV